MSFLDSFIKVYGPETQSLLKSLFYDHKPIIVLSGNQCSGKSTIAKRLAIHLGGKSIGTGQVFRSIAAKEGLSAERLSELLSNGKTIFNGVERSVQDFELIKSADEFDINLDFEGVKAIATASDVFLQQNPDQTSGYVAVYDCRLAGYITSLLRKLGRKNIYSINLLVSPWVQAERYLKREFNISQSAAEDIQVLFKNHHITDLKTAFEVFLDSSLAPKILSGDQILLLNEKRKIIEERDSNDLTRLRNLYNIGTGPHNGPEYDLQICTNETSIDEVIDSVLQIMTSMTQSSSSSDVKEIQIGEYMSQHHLPPPPSPKDIQKITKPSYYKTLVPGIFSQNIEETGECLIETDINKIVWALQLPPEMQNVYKYCARAGKKDPGKEIEDLEKAKEYLDIRVLNLRREIALKNK